MISKAVSPDAMGQTRATTWLWVALMCCAVLMTIKYFPGFENETAYSGNAYQMVHPDAFQGDVYQGPDKPLVKRPFQLSLIYAVIALTGDIWLDDRFVAVIYIGLVFAALVGIERIAAYLGLSNPLARLVVVLLFLKDHQILANKVLVAHHPDVNHFAFAIPLIVWLLYAALARKGWPLVLTLSGVLVATSIRNAVVPVFISMCLQAYHGGSRDRLIVAAMMFVGAVVAYVGLFHLIPIPEPVRLDIWDLVKGREGGSANPWHDWTAAGALFSALWFALIAAGFVACRHGGEKFSGIRVVLVAGLAVWFVGGLYISFAPDVLKQPMLIGLAPTRTLAWPQIVAMIAIAAALLMWIEESQTFRRVILATGGLSLIYITGPGNHEQWTALVAASGVGVAVLAGFRYGFSALPDRIASVPSAFIAAVFGFTTIVSYSVAAKQKFPEWRVAYEHGVFGAASSARWIGVDEYVRNHTPVDAAILPYYRLGDGRLIARRSFGVRTGRAMPVPEPYSDIRNPDAWVFESAQQALVLKIGEDLDTSALAGTRERIDRLVPVPDIIIVPADVGDHVAWPEIGFRRDATVAGYVLARSVKE